MAENNKLVLEFDNGDKESTEIIGVFDYNEKDYIALEPENNKGEVYIFIYKEGTDGEYELDDITDEEEFKGAAKAFDELQSK